MQLRKDIRTRVEKGNRGEYSKEHSTMFVDSEIPEKTAAVAAKMCEKKVEKSERQLRYIFFGKTTEGKIFE